MVDAAGEIAASLPPDDLDGLDPAWSRLVRVPSTDGVGRTWHLLDNQVADPTVTLLCVHGNPSWSYLYRDLVRRAPGDVRVIAVDQLDMGFSERSGTVRRLATRIDDLTQLTDELALTGEPTASGPDVELTVLDEGGRPVAGATVSGGPFGSRRTDEQGRLQATRVVPGSYRVRVRAGHGPGRRRTFEVPSTGELHRTSVAL